MRARAEKRSVLGWNNSKRLLRVPHIKTSCYLMVYDNKEGFRIIIYSKVELINSGSWGSVDREELYNFREANNTMQSIESGV